jgi:hypothetical protein
VAGSSPERGERRDDVVRDPPAALDDLGSRSRNRCRCRPDGRLSGLLLRCPSRGAPTGARVLGTHQLGGVRVPPPASRREQLRELLGRLPFTEIAHERIEWNVVRVNPIVVHARRTVLDVNPIVVDVNPIVVNVNPIVFVAKGDLAIARCARSCGCPKRPFCPSGGTVSGRSERRSQRRSLGSNSMIEPRSTSVFMGGRIAYRATNDRGPVRALPRARAKTEKTQTRSARRHHRALQPRGVPLAACD